MKFAVLVLCSLALGACGGDESDKAGGKNAPKATVLTLANGNHDSRNLEPFAAAVERLSKGTLRIRFQNRWRDGELGYEAGIIRDVKAGKAALGAAGSRAFEDTALEALHAPLLIDSYPYERKVLESPIAAGMLDELEPLGVVGIGILPGPMRKPLGATPLAAPEGYVGATIAFQHSRVAEATLRLLGARAAEIPISGPIDRYDGVEQQVSSIASNLYDKTAPYLAANVNLWPRPAVVFANPKAFAGLDDRQRTALRQAAPAALPATLKLEQHDDVEGTTALCGRGVTFLIASDPELAAVRRAVRPVYAELRRHPSTRAAIAEIQALRPGVAAGPDAPACSGGESRAAGRPTPLDGVYLLTSTREQVARVAGAERLEEIPPENYGSWRFTFDRGRLRYTQSGKGHTRWTEATYSVKADTLTFTVTDFGGEAPTASQEKTGEVFTFAWSLYRDRLTLKAVKGKISPPPFIVRSLRRVEGAP